MKFADVWYWFILAGVVLYLSLQYFMGGGFFESFMSGTR